MEDRYDSFRALYLDRLIDKYLEQEHESLKAQIRELKVALEHSQILRRRKMEYDVVAEKINVLPSREELEQYVNAYYRIQI